MKAWMGGRLVASGLVGEKGIGLYVITYAVVAAVGNTDSCYNPYEFLHSHVFFVQC
jgi:hypothetical protein